MKNRRLPKIILFITAIILSTMGGLLSHGTVTARADEGNSFIFAAAVRDSVIVEPVAVTYEEGDTVLDALKGSDISFVGLEQGYVAAVEGTAGNFYITQDDGGYDLTRPASEIRLLVLTEDISYTPEFADLVLKMGEFKTSENNVQNYKAAADAYRDCLDALRQSMDNEALNNALSDRMNEYEAILNGEKHTVNFSILQGSNAVSSANITMKDAYGNITEAAGNSVDVIEGEYSFTISDGGWNRTEGTLSVTGAQSVSVTLPSGEWFGSVGFTDSTPDLNPYRAENHPDEHRIVVYVPDTKNGAGIRYNIERGPDQYPKESGDTLLRAIYKSSSGDDYSTRVRSWGSTTANISNSVDTGMGGKTFPFEAWYTGDDGFVQKQSYFVEIKRLPTLTDLVILDENGTNIMPGDYDPLKMQYDITVTGSEFNVYGTGYGEDYEIGISGGLVSGNTFTLDENGNASVSVDVRGNTEDTNSYVLNLTKVQPAAVSFNVPAGTELDVINPGGSVIMPSSGDTYMLVPGLTYKWVATKDTYFHTTGSFTASNGANITVAEPETVHALSDLKFYNANSASTREEYGPDTAFTKAHHEYTYVISDMAASPYVQATPVSGTDYAVSAIYINQTTSTSTNGKATDKSVTTTVGNGRCTFLTSFIAIGGYSNTASIRLSKTEEGVEYYQDYNVLFKRDLHIRSMEVFVSGEKALLRDADGRPLNYDRDIKDYYVNVTATDKSLLINGEFCQTSTPPGCDYHIDHYKGTSDDPLEMNFDLEELPEDGIIALTICHSDENSLPAEYRIHVKKVDPFAISFNTDPEAASVFVKDTATGKPVYENEGTFALYPGIEYQYTVSCPGYILKQDVYTPVSDDVVDISLEEAPANPALENFDAPWPYFRADEDNNGVVNSPTPLTPEDTALYWAAQLGSGWDSGAAGCPILVGDYLYTYGSAKPEGSTERSNMIFKMNTVTGEIEDTGLMARGSSFSINSPAYADGMMFVGLSNGGVQAFNAATMESLWIYNDDLKGQPNCPIVYKDGYIYTGFWQGETSDADFVCISVTDEDPNNTLEEKKATWTYTFKGGFYWAGACATDDYIIVGTDDGQPGISLGKAHILTFDPASGKLLGDLELQETGDIRCSMVRDPIDRNSFYFATKGGYFYKITVGTDGSLSHSNLRKIKLTNYANDPANPAMSSSSPVIYNGRAYIGASGTGLFMPYSGHNITVIDLNTWGIAYTARMQGYPQASGLLTTYYSGDTGKVYIYFQDNQTPGKTRILEDSPGQREPAYTETETFDNKGQPEYYETVPVLFTPSGAQAQYGICSQIADEYGTIYFKNDSAYMMAIGSAIEEIKISHIPHKMNYDEGEVFDPAGIEVTAYYKNGRSRDITRYISYSEEPLTADDEDFAIRFEHIMYQDKDHEGGYEITPPTAYLKLKIGDDEVFGDVNQDGKVTDLDMELVQDHINGRTDLSEQEITLGDVDLNGKLNVSDVYRYYRYLRGELESLKP